MTPPHTRTFVALIADVFKARTVKRVVYNFGGFGESGRECLDAIRYNDRIIEYVSKSHLPNLYSQTIDSACELNFRIK